MKIGEKISEYIITNDEFQVECIFYIYICIYPETFYEEDVFKISRKKCRVFLFFNKQKF